MRPFTNSLTVGVPAARVAYRVGRPGRHPRLHGVWWPYSDDLAVELPALVGALHSRGFTVRTVSFSEKSWRTAPPQLWIAGRMVRASPFRTSRPTGSIRLAGGDRRSRIDLLVVPSGSHPALAAHVFGRVLDWNPFTASTPDGVAGVAGPEPVLEAAS